MLRLEDFIPAYPSFDEIKKEKENIEENDDLFDIYDGINTEDIFYNKKEFESLPEYEEKPKEKGKPLKTQYNISRFLSPFTMNDKILLLHGLGSGKCVHPSTKIFLNNKEDTIENFYKKYTIEDDKNLITNILNTSLNERWEVPTNDLYVESLYSLNEFNNIKSRIKFFFKQYVNEDLVNIFTKNNNIICTKIHKLLCLYKGKWIWKKSHELSVNDILLTKSGKEIIEKIETFFYKGYVYDLEIENTSHIYIANNFYTHNTCSAINIVELAKIMNPSYRPALIILKPSLKRNFINELLNVCTRGQYIPDNYEQLTTMEKTIRTKKLYSKNYDIHSYGTFASKIYKYSDEYLKKEFSNRVIILDEIQGMRIQTKKGKRNINVYKIFHKFLHIVENVKIVLMSGTPFKDSEIEFSSVFNLLLPLNNQLPEGKEFTRKFFNKNKLINKKELKEKVRGKVSVVRSLESNIVKMNMGELYNELNKLKVFKGEMSKFQTQVYKEAFFNDTKGKDINDLEEIEEEQDEKRGLYNKSREASLFVYPLPDDLKKSLNELKKKKEKLLKKRKIIYESEEENDIEENIDEDIKNDIDDDIDDDIEEDINDDIKNDIDEKDEKVDISKQKNGLYGRDGYLTYIENKSLKNDPESIKKKSEIKINYQNLKNELTEFGTASNSKIIENIRKYSSIYANTIEEIISHPNEICFVYNKFVHGSGGILFSKLLELFNYQSTKGNIDIDAISKSNINLWEEFSKKIKDKDDISNSEKEYILETIDTLKTQKSFNTENINELKLFIKYLNMEDFISMNYNKNNSLEILKNTFINDLTTFLEKEKINNKKRYAIVTGETTSQKDIERIIDNITNDPRNKYGDYIQVIIGSILIGEGKSIKNVRQIHIQTPHWNNSETEQAIGRGIRAFSLDDLPLNERFVKIFRHCAIPEKGIISVNYLMYKRSEDKDIKIKQLERVLKESAVDCYLNKSRNSLLSDVDYTRNCEYLKCKYNCDIIPEEREKFIDTYGLFFGEDDIEAISTIIKNMFRLKFSYTIQDILLTIQDKPLMIILRALKNIIDSNILLTNRYGFPSYLREENDIYFLVDNITLPSNMLLTYYNIYPNIKNNYTYNELLQETETEYFKEKAELLLSYDPDDEEDNKDLTRLFDNFSDEVKQIFLEASFLKPPKIESEEKIKLKKFIKNYFNPYLTFIGNNVISSYTKVDSEKTYRCFNKIKNNWEDCDEKLVEKLEEIKLEKKDMLKNIDIGFSGIIQKNKFKIKNKADIRYKKDGTVDSRTLHGGKSCESYTADELTNFILTINKKDINIPETKKIEIKNRELMIKKLLTYNIIYTNEELENIDDDKLSNIYYWTLYSNKIEKCAKIKEYLINNNLVEYF